MDKYVPKTPYQLAALRARCYKALETASEYEQDLAQQYGIRPLPSGKFNVLFLHKLVNRLMTPGRNCGKKELAVRLLDTALLKVASKLPEDPVVALMWALIRNAPMVSTRTSRQGSINVAKKVFLSQKVRARIALHKLIENKRTKNAADALAGEIIAAYNEEPRSRLTAHKQNLLKAAKIASE